MPFGFDVRVSARWSAGRAKAESGLWTVWPRRALAFAVLIVLVTLAANYRSLVMKSTSEWSFEENSLQLGMYP
jgi:hypothetical protein